MSKCLIIHFILIKKYFPVCLSCESIRRNVFIFQVIECPFILIEINSTTFISRSLRGRDRMVVGLTTTPGCNQCLSPLTLWVRIPLRWGVLDTSLCDEICRWFSPGIPISSTNKTDRHDITEILLKVALNTIPLTP